MAFPRTDSISWWLYRDASCSATAAVFHGRFDLSLVQRPTRRRTSEYAPNSSSDHSLATLQTTGLQLVPEVQSHVWDLLDRRSRLCDPQQRTPLTTRPMDEVEVFPVAVKSLSLSAEAAAERGLSEDKALLYCKLQLNPISRCGAGAAKTEDRRQENDWFSWKLQRAEEYRRRGNEAFKRESYCLAVQLYTRALAWLEPPAAWSETTLPTKGQYSLEELQQVNHVAIACYANMATSYSKINGDKDVDRCITAASSALAIDDAHVKARYRRSQACVQSKAFDLALADLTKLLELDPANNLFRAAFARARHAKTQFCKKQQNAFANLFSE
ncbi:unnamed protein product [Hyaloperonospora brassicae]|uniref:Uncharacterized protein n=1 Tax=Hyaloperonospora brassicae TaxID=162125 RepID=A0AAV0UNI3_HYABA|nr:unnamed protein product [Hyaloperonospora brassicae]